MPLRSAVPNGTLEFWRVTRTPAHGSLPAAPLSCGSGSNLRVEKSTSGLKPNKSPARHWEIVLSGHYALIPSAYPSQNSLCKGAFSAVFLPICSFCLAGGLPGLCLSLQQSNHPSNNCCFTTSFSKGPEISHLFPKMFHLQAHTEALTNTIPSRKYQIALGFLPGILPTLNPWHNKDHVLR